VRVISIDELIGQFIDQCLVQLDILGVDVGSLVQTAEPATGAKKSKGRGVPSGRKGAGK
jgi:hypothetical protein